MSLPTFHHCGGTDPLCNCQVEDMERLERYRARRLETDLRAWKSEYLDALNGQPLRRTCWECGHGDTPHVWYLLPSSVNKPMCEPCYAVAVKSLREDLARGVVF